VTATGANSLRNGPDEQGHFGLYGGRFVAETLMPLILDLERAYRAAQARIRLPGRDEATLPRTMSAGQARSISPSG
jgi:hypothetical protein